MNYSDMFFYDETSPSCLRWKLPRCGVEYGLQAGTKKSCGYYIAKVNGSSNQVHNIIWELFNGPIPDKHLIDHIDRNKVNNKISNLRLATMQQNLMNRRNKKSSLGFIGIAKTTDGYYEARVNINGKKKTVKTCKCPADAALERDLAAYPIYGEFGVYNFPEFVKAYCKK